MTTATEEQDKKELNYFNYFTEIEDTFVRRRGRHLILSPVDWALIETWREMGIPLHVVINGIERAFDSYYSKPRRRTVKTLLYCQEEVEAQYGEWLDSQVGGNSIEEPEDSFSNSLLLEHVRAAAVQLHSALGEANKRGTGQLSEALTRAISRLEELERDCKLASKIDSRILEDKLTDLEKLIDSSLFASLGKDELLAKRDECEAQLKSYKKLMDENIYQQTLNNLVTKSLRERFGVPRLSLFYL
jgi:hypothetical protein